LEYCLEFLCLSIYFFSQSNNYDLSIYNNPDRRIALLSKNEEYIRYFKENILASTQLFFMTMNEAQGVEFDIVCSMYACLGRITYIRIV